MPRPQPTRPYEDQYERYQKHNRHVGTEMQPMGWGMRILIAACTVGPFIVWGLIS